MASTDVLVHLNMNGNEIQNVTAQSLAATPPNVRERQFWYDSNNHTMVFYNGSSVVDMGAQGRIYTEGTGIDISAGGEISVDFSAVATAAQGALADSALQSGDDISELNNDVGYITGITSSDVITALGYTPYNSSNPSGYQANVIEGIKVNGTSQTPTNKVINLTIPTTAADIGALPSSTKYGAAFVASLNTTDYKLTLTLKDQDGNTLGTAQVVDFPIESVVVGGSYDSTNQKIILTLQNGTTIDVPVGDLIAGLQTEITSENPLDADLVDDTTSAHKFVTNAQRTQIATNTSAIADLQATTITASSTNTLTNKTIDADDNTISDLTTSNLKSSAIATSISTTGVDTKLATEKAVRSAITTAMSTGPQKQIITCPALTPSGGVCTWNIGAYQYDGSTIIPIDCTVFNSNGDKIITSFAFNDVFGRYEIKINSTTNIAAGAYKAIVIY